MEDIIEADTVVVFFVNGKKVADPYIDPEWTLLYYLREKLCLTGTKLGCGTGGCGTCTVMISYYNHKTENVIHQARRACLIRVASLHGHAVTTVEGIGSTFTKLHPVQKRIAEAHGSQCGFCTPGMVMSMYTLLRNTSSPTMLDIENALKGNLCRCTGYRPIIEGFSSFAIDGKTWKPKFDNEEKENECPLGENCCKYKTKDAEEDKIIELFNKTEYTPYDPSQEPIFPPELKILSRNNNMKPLILRGKRIRWYQPTKLEDILAVKAKLKKSAHVIAGNTKLGIEESECATNVHPVFIHPMNIREMTEVQTTDTALRVGAALTLTELEDVLKAEIKSHPEHETRLFTVLLKILDVFGSQQIRNMCSIGGHIMSSSPVSDLNQIFAAASCLLEVRSKERGVKTIILDHSFFDADERKNNIEDDEIIMALHIPYTRKNQYLESFKHSRRRIMDSAIINMTLNVEFEADTNKVENVSLVFGGVANKIVAAKKTENLLIQRKWNEETLQLALEALMDEFCLPPGSNGGMETYRNALVLSLFFKAYISVGINLKKKRIQNGNILPEDYESAVTLSQDQQHLKSSQYFQMVPATEEEHIIGKPAVHKSAFKQAAGEAIYCDDIPHIQNELHLALVCSTEPHARIKCIDTSDALALDGVVAFYSAEDLTPEQNNYGSFSLQDEYIFAPGVVTCIGQIIGAVVGESKTIAQQAAKLVKIEYEVLEPIITIQDAIEKNSYHKEPMVIIKGDIENVLRSSDHVIKGELRIEGQEHFYMETHVTIAIPKQEDCEMEVICSSQNLTEVQRLTANLLGVQRNKIVCKIRRLGGGFGGKELRPSILHLPVTFAAYKLRRPVRCMLDRDEDMEISGGRHPFYGHYELGFSNEGKILGCKMTMYINGGHTIDLSEVVLERAVTHIQNAYLIPVVSCKGYACKTNLPSNTVFRGAGGPQAMLFAETMIRDVAKFLNKDPLEVSALNLYKKGDLTYYGQVIKDVNVRKCWDECLKNSDYFTRRTEVDAFNRKNKWKKRGLAVVPTMYGVGYTAVHLNQAGALILVYLDGSVLLTHGGCEGGQGLHTKMIQVASEVLEIPDKYIHISETSTDKVPNATPSSASVCSDLNGMAVLKIHNHKFFGKYHNEAANMQKLFQSGAHTLPRVHFREAIVTIISKEPLFKEPKWLFADDGDKLFLRNASKNACKVIAERIRPFKMANPKGEWVDWVNAAYMARVSLSATGYYKTPYDQYDWKNLTGDLYHYFTNGAGCSEVEIDCLTGDHKVLRTDIVMDIGQSLNPAIDVGQIEGAFIQGYGLFVMEQLLYSPKGKLLNKGPNLYKIPTLSDIPKEFNVSILQGTSNPRVIFSSKAVGEPPLFLASSVFFAIKDAICAARSDNGCTSDFQFDSPATCEKIRTACVDHIMKKVPKAREDGYVPWNIRLC